MPNPWLAILWAAAAIATGWVAVWIAVPLLVFPPWYAFSEGQSSDLLTALRALMKTPTGIVSATMIMQVAACLFVLWRARRDGARPVVDQLGLTRSRIAWWVWPFIFFASWTISWIGSIMMWLGQSLGLLPTAAPIFDRDMKALMDATGPQAVIVALLLGLAAGVGEELVMRGYLQRRLLRRWPAWRAILVTSLLFAAFHLDISHIVGIVPIGLWFGYVAWRADSVKPTIIVHGCIDATYFLMALAGSAFTNSLKDELIPLILLSLTSLPVSIVALEMAARNSARTLAAPLPPTPPIAQ